MKHPLFPLSKAIAEAGIVILLVSLGLSAGVLAAEDEVDEYERRLSPAPSELFNQRPQEDSYEIRKSRLLPLRPFVNDPCSVETALDNEDFQKINGLKGVPIMDNPHGWSVVARIGGRPFLCFTRITLDGVPWSFVERRDFAPGNSGIPQRHLDDHFAAGKTINRLWFTHRVGKDDNAGHPIVVVFTPDGFFNLGAAKPPKLQGAVARIGFIREPFSSVDYLQHIDNLAITTLDDHTLRLLFDIHSQAGEGVIEAELHWNTPLEQPELHLRAAHVTRRTRRVDPELGFAGINFLRGPTLTDIAAFHDGRSLFIEQGDGSVVRNLLIPPVTHTYDRIIQQDLLEQVSLPARLIMDQPQDVRHYFSKLPGIPYWHRADLILELRAGPNAAIKVHRAQKAVNLSAGNPEADETVNVFYTAAMPPEQVAEFSYRFILAAEDFESRFAPRQAGVVLVSNEAWPHGGLFFLPLDERFQPLGPPQPLTDGVIKDPHRPSVSADGRWVIFDADDYNVSRRQRIYLLDLWSGKVRRLTIDPWGPSDDRVASLNADSSRFALITDRGGNPTLNIEKLDLQDPEAGLETGAGNRIRSLQCAEDAHWSQQRDEIALICDQVLHILDAAPGRQDKIVQRIPLAQRHPRHPRFSPDGKRLAYAADSGVYIVNRDGSGNGSKPVLPCPDHPPKGDEACADHPTWADDTRLIVQQTTEDGTGLYLLDLAAPAGPENPFPLLKPDKGSSRAKDNIRYAEPAFVPAAGG